MIETLLYDMAANPDYWLYYDGQQFTLSREPQDGALNYKRIEDVLGFMGKLTKAYAFVSFIDAGSFARHSWKSSKEKDRAWRQLFVSSITKKGISLLEALLKEMV